MNLTTLEELDISPPSDILKRVNVTHFETSFTNRFYNALTVPIDELDKVSEEDDIWIQGATVVGWMMSGKTTLSKTLAAILEDYYSPNFNVQVVIANNVLDALLNIESGTEVAVLIVDDAPLGHPSRTRKEMDIINAQAYFAARHIFYRKSRRAKYVLLFFCTQRYRSLDKNFRLNPILIFKTAFIDPEENYEIAKMVGRLYLAALKYIYMMVYEKHKREYLSYSVVKIPSGKEVVVAPPPMNPSRITRVTLGLEHMIKAQTESQIKYAIELLIEGLAKSNVSWYTIQTSLLPSLRRIGVRINDRRAFKAYQRGCICIDT